MNIYQKLQYAIQNNFGWNDNFVVLIMALNLETLLNHLNEGNNLNKLDLKNDIMNELNLLTDKPILFILNVHARENP